MLVIITALVICGCAKQTAVTLKPSGATADELTAAFNRGVTNGATVTLTIIMGHMLANGSNTIRLTADDILAIRENAFEHGSQQ